MTWRAQLLEGREDLRILFLRGDFLPELPSSLGLLVLDRYTVKGEANRRKQFL